MDGNGRNGRDGLVKREPVIVAEPRTDEYSIGYVLRHRKSWRKLPTGVKDAYLQQLIKKYDPARGEGR